MQKAAHSHRYPHAIMLRAIMLTLAGLSGCLLAIPGMAQAAKTAIPAAPAGAQAPMADQARPAALARSIDAYLSQSRFDTANWGISVVSLNSGRILYTHRADKLAIPASNTKLYTAALALATLGPNFRTHTTLYATARPRNGIINGDLILYGRGDPTLGNGDDTHAPTAWADHMAKTLARRGVIRVHGSLVADDTYFAGPNIPSGWEASDLQTWYAPPASALTADGNMFRLRVRPEHGLCCQVTTTPAMPGITIINLTQTDPSASVGDLGIYRPPGSRRLYVYGGMKANAKSRHFALAAPDPALMAGHLLLQALVRQGIHVDGDVRALHWPQQNDAIGAPQTVKMSDVRSPRLKDIVHHMLKHSDNLYAQLTLQQAGAYAQRQGSCPDRRTPPRTTNGWAVCAMRTLFGQIGIGYGHAHIAEGSGLSRKDLVSPAATTTLLAWAARQPFAKIYHDALPIAGVDGTLRWRLRKSVATNNLSAKTGTLSYSYTLSGYVTDAAGKPLVFSLMLDAYARPINSHGYHVRPSPQNDLDAIASIIVNYGGR